MKYELDGHHKGMPVWPQERNMREARRTLRKLLDDRRSFVLVAETKEGEAIGMLTYRIVRRETRHSGYRMVADVGMMFVGERYRRLGVGRALVARCIEHLERRGVQHVTLRSVVANAQGNRFWDSLGLKPLLYIRSAPVARVKGKL